MYTRGESAYVIGSSLIYFSNTRKSLKFYGNYQSNLLNCGLSVQLQMHIVQFRGNDYTCSENVETKYNHIIRR